MSDGATRDEGNGKAVAIGQLVTRLDGMAATLERIERRLDALAEWQRATDARLATGAERMKQHADEIGILRQRDTAVGLLGVLITTIGSAIAAVLGMRQ